MDQFTLAEFAKVSENKEGADFTPEVQEQGIEQGELIVSKLYNTMLGSITKVMKSWNAEIVKVLSEAGLTPSALTNEQLYNAILALIGRNSYGCQLGDLIPNISTTSPLGRVLCNGQRLTDCATMFPDFYTYVKTKTPYKTVAEFNAQVTAYGQCGFCAVDGNDVIVPLITRPISGVSNLNQTGQALNDTMRPITGTFASGDKYDEVPATGAFYKLNETNRTAGDGTNRPKKLGFDSGRLGTAYSGSETRGKQVQYPYYIQVYTTSNTGVANVAELVDLLKYQNQLGITAISSTSGNISLAAGGLYTMTLSDNTVFTLPTPEDTTMFNQIMLQLHITNASATIDWGTTVYFQAEPTIAEGFYNIVWEYDVLQGAWVVGQLTKVS